MIGILSETNENSEEASYEPMGGLLTVAYFPTPVMVHTAVMLKTVGFRGMGIQSGC